MSTRGVIISFEGIDGVGKSLQVFRLQKALELKGYDVVLRKEPGSSNVGEGIRELLFKNPTTKQMAPGVADALFLADHIQNAADIEQYVSEGKVVLCDRYADSQFAYAASIGKNCPPWALAAYETCFGIIPDITVMLLARGPQITLEESLKCRPIFIEDIGWALARAQARRGVEAGKQDGKAWNNVQDQLRIQNEYIRRLVSQPRTVAIDVWEASRMQDVTDCILQQVVARISGIGNSI